MNDFTVKQIKTCSNTAGTDWIPEQTTSTVITAFCCRQTGKQCLNATEYGYCKLTYCTEGEWDMFELILKNRDEAIDRYLKEIGDDGEY